jgi:hypothetical protein
MTAVEKVKEAERQILGVIRGQCNVVQCPFCGLESEAGQVLCCEQMADMVEIVLDTAEAKAMFEHVEQVMDRWQKAGLN